MALGFVRELGRRVSEGFEQWKDGGYIEGKGLGFYLGKRVARKLGEVPEPLARFFASSTFRGGALGLGF